jgi:hypothetical protein
MFKMILNDIIDPNIDKMIKYVIGFKTQMLTIFNRFIISNPQEAFNFINSNY